MVTNYESVLKTVTSFLIYPLVFIVVTLTIWGINPNLLSVTESSSLLPFVIIFVLSLIGSEIAYLIKLPKIVGMILAGFALSNATDGIINFNPLYSDVIRNIALGILLVQAGLELDLGMIKRMSSIVLRLCFIPMIAEILVTTITGHYILGLPIVWSVMLGLILSAACAAIVVPNMIEIKRQGLGVEKGIPSIITAACSLDDVFAIAGFGITIGFAFPSNESSSLTWKILKAPVEILIGITLGTAYGLIISYFPDPESDRTSSVNHQSPGTDEVTNSGQENQQKISRNNSIRLILLTFGGFAFIFASTQMDFAGTGPLGVLVLAAVAGYRLRQYQHICEPIVNNLDKLWSFLSVFLFSLIGADVKITNIDENIVLSIFAVIIIGMAFRILTTYGSLSYGGLNFKEKSYISIAWLSKAAVQAAVGPVALTIARTRCPGNCDDDSDIKFAKIILTTSVFAVLICAPLGALGMAFTGKRFLSKSSCPAIVIDNNAENLNKVRQVAIIITDGAKTQAIESKGTRRSV